jgi:hypothetical protein
MSASSSDTINSPLGKRFKELEKQLENIQRSLESINDSICCINKDPNKDTYIDLRVGQVNIGFLVFCLICLRNQLSGSQPTGVISGQALNMIRDLKSTLEDNQISNIPSLDESEVSSLVDVVQRSEELLMHKKDESEELEERVQLVVDIEKLHDSLMKKINQDI